MAVASLQMTMLFIVHHDARGRQLKFGYGSDWFGRKAYSKKRTRRGGRGNVLLGLARGPGLRFAAGAQFLEFVFGILEILQEDLAAAGDLHEPVISGSGGA
jgi:hypothetical protein